MKEYGLFDLIGPQMIGPSSSHTAGAARIGYVASRMAGGCVKKAIVTLYGSFAETGKGHGTDKAVIAGLLGFAPDDDRLRIAPQLAKEWGRDIRVEFSDEEMKHPNTAGIVFENEDGRKIHMTGASIGGGNIEIQSINGMDVSFGCDYPTLLIFHQDRPGVISSVTGVLAEHEINIAFMKVFRNSRWQNACMVIETDGEVEDCLVEQIRSENQDIVEVCKL
ncbi:L-serine ammonia-lyase, iron-sulfur-dependent subunit beta [Coprococcus catus]|uniref:L-serine ammonia-lyase, iron-sulfur-dependent subunit beta n=1 Tax=Coprococcus catus TaxID=116085 RepID=UPI001C029013|nr:L-serine ammonia-lyase, iron-sulfur-dependent subunit beta [Coprococcus catus]MBT9772102.1 L-serine ammonia-lyase, iron-sulfur-dependent, subunit beta [Coprococcus catus]